VRKQSKGSPSGEDRPAVRGQRRSRATLVRLDVRGSYSTRLMSLRQELPPGLVCGGWPRPARALAGVSSFVLFVMLVITLTSNA